MNHSTLQSRFIIVARYLFVLLFVYAAVSKLLDFETFKVQIGEIEFMGAYATGIAWLLIGMQLFTAGLLLLTHTRRLGLYLSFALLCLFSSYTFSVLNFSSYVPCACAGIFPGMGWHFQLYFNIVLALIAFLTLFLEKKRTSRYLRHTT